MKRPRLHRLARRLLLAHVVVLVAGVVVFVTVAGTLGPGIFLRQVTAATGGALGPETDGQLLAAFAGALSSSLGIGLAVALLAAAIVSTLLAVRIARPVENLAASARAIENGRSGARAPVPGAADELQELTLAFNAMAARLEATESVRRRLLGDLTHELRTPLATLEGYLEGLRDGIVDPDVATLATMTEATLRLHRLVDDVGEVSRAEEGELDLRRERVDLAAVATAAIAGVEPGYRDAGVRLRPQPVAGPPPLVEGDRDRLIQLVTNLLTNAAAHSANGDVVEVGTGADDDTVTLWVTDQGVGILPEDLPHVFDRFYRADRSRGLPGSGLGLTIARSLARAHGGDLRAASDGAGSGASFRLTLPRLPASG